MPDQACWLSCFISFGGVNDWANVLAHFGKVRADHAELIRSYRDRDVEAAEEVSTRHVILFRERIIVASTKVVFDRPGYGRGVEV